MKEPLPLGLPLGLFLLLLVFGLAGCRAKPSSREETGAAMGTSWRLIVHSKESGSLRGIVTTVLAQQEMRFSNWRLDSEVSRLEVAGGAASDEMLSLLALGERVKEESEGAFDVAWDGGIDLGGIAKGWAVDQVVRALAEGGAANFIFELGGEVGARGEGPAGRGWPVAIERPSPNAAISDRVERIVFLENEALATSGNYHQPEHLKDGRTGETVGGGFRSVSVVMASCAAADAWATALFALGEEPAGFQGFKGRVYWNQ